MLYMNMGLLLGLQKDATIWIHLEGIKRDKPVTKRQTLYDSTSFKFTEGKKRTVVARAWGGAGNRHCSQMGTEFQFCRMKKFWRSVTQGGEHFTDLYT